MEEECKVLEFEHNPRIHEHLGDLGRKVPSWDGLAFVAIF